MFEPLGIPYNTVEFFADVKTMDFDYIKRHKGYYDKLMDGIKDRSYKGENLIDVFKRPSELPLWFHNLGGGSFNFTLCYMVFFGKFS